MKQSIGYVAVVVEDYDDAIKFYVIHLDLISSKIRSSKLKTSAGFGSPHPALMNRSCYLRVRLAWNSRHA